MSAPITSIWYTRCPVPSALSIAAQLGWLKEDFAAVGIEVRSIGDSKDKSVRESHFDHRLAHSFRQGGNVPALWARSKGAATRLIALSWVDEFQAIVALPKSGIRKPSDLAGRRYGVPRRPNDLIDFNRPIALKGLHSALSLAGLPTTAAEIVNLTIEESIIVTHDDPALFGSRHRTPYATELFALIQGKIDAFFVKGAEGINIAKFLGGTIVADLGRHIDPAIRANSGTPRTLTVDEALIEARPDLVERLLDTVSRAAAWAVSHPMETRTFVAREIGASEEAVSAAFGPDLHLRLGISLDPEWISGLATYKDFLRDNGSLVNDFSVEQWIDHQPLSSLIRRAA